MFFCWKIITHRIHRRLTGSFQASPDPKVSEVPLQAGAGFATLVPVGTWPQYGWKKSQRGHFYRFYRLMIYFLIFCKLWGIWSVYIVSIEIFREFEENDYVVVSNILYFHPHLGKIPILTNIFQRGWFNHQLDEHNSQRTSTFNRTNNPQAASTTSRRERRAQRREAGKTELLKEICHRFGYITHQKQKQANGVFLFQDFLKLNNPRTWKNELLQKEKETIFC